MIEEFSDIARCIRTKRWWQCEYPKPPYTVSFSFVYERSPYGVCVWRHWRAAGLLLALAHGWRHISRIDPLKAFLAFGIVDVGAEGEIPTWRWPFSPLLWKRNGVWDGPWAELCRWWEHKREWRRIAEHLKSSAQIERLSAENARLRGVLARLARVFDEMNRLAPGIESAEALAREVHEALKEGENR